MAAHQAPLSLGSSRREHWSGMPFASPKHKSEKWKWSRSVVSHSLRPHGLEPNRLPRPWDFPGKSTGVGCHCLLQGSCLYDNKRNTQPVTTFILYNMTFSEELKASKYFKLPCRFSEPGKLPQKAAHLLGYSSRFRERCLLSAHNEGQLPSSWWHGDSV